MISAIKVDMGNEWTLLQIIILQKSIKELLPWKGAELLGQLIWQLPEQLERFFLSKVLYDCLSPKDMLQEEADH